jgi:hypothetical protein
LSTAPTTIRSYGPNGGGATLRTGISGGLSVPAAASGSTIDSTVTIQSQYYDYTIDTGSGANTASGDLVVNGSLTGGNVVKAGAGSLRLNGSVGVSSITVNAGTLQVDTGIGTATSLTVANTATLAGVADFFYYGPTLQSGSTLAPGDNGIGTMTFYNVFNTIVDFPDALTLVPGSTTVMEMSKFGSTLTNDVLKILSGTLTYGGSLRVTNIGVGVLAAGDSFRLFDAPAYASSFSSQTLPALSGSLVWNTTQLSVNGTITVVSGGVNTIPTNIIASVTGTNLNLSWPADHTGWRLLSQTNHLANGVSSNTNDWGAVTGSASTNQIIIPIVSTNKAGFFRLIYP